MAALVLAALSGACAAENWGGPGPAHHAKSPDRAPPAANQRISDTQAQQLTQEPTTPPPEHVRVIVETRLVSGDVPGWQESADSAKDALTRCADGHADIDAVVQLVAQIDDEGRVRNVDRFAGTSFREGAVPCMEAALRGLSFRRPPRAAPDPRDARERPGDGRAPQPASSQTASVEWRVITRALEE